MELPEALLSRVPRLLALAGIDGSIIHMTPCATSGGNNLIHRLETQSGLFAVKQYFRHENDPRDRLSGEYGFLQYAAKVTPGMVPIPYAYDAEAGLALYEYIEGKNFKAGEIAWPQVSAAADFFCALNHPEHRSKAKGLPEASEACFSLSDHLSLIQRRIQRLLEAPQVAAVDGEAHGLCESLHALLQSLMLEIKQWAGDNQFDLDIKLDDSQRCVSPSDFGFHNAMMDAEGVIRFIDFEYAGWDDPAKMVGDFFAQLAVPVPAEYFDRFVVKALQVFPGADHLTLRARLLRPVYQIKWCCIALNIFLPVNLARRQFARPDLDVVELKNQQLAKAEQLFQSIQRLSYDLH